MTGSIVGKVVNCTNAESSTAVMLKAASNPLTVTKLYHCLTFSTDKEHQAVDIYRSLERSAMIVL